MFVIKILRLSRIQAAKDVISEGFINTKDTNKKDSKLNLDSKNETKSTCTIEEQHHHLLRCLEKTTVIIILF